MNHQNKLVYRLFNSPTLMTWGSRLVRAFNILWVLPLVITKFSTAEIKLWYSLAAFMALASIADFGFSATFIRVLSFAQIKETERSDHQYAFTVAKILPLMRKVYLFLSFLFIIGIVFSYWALSDNIWATAQPNRSLTAFVVVAVGTMFFIYGNLFTSFLIGLNKVALTMRWDTLSNLGAVITSVIVLTFDGDILALALAQQSWILFNIIRNYWLVRQQGSFRFSPDHTFDKALFQVIWEKAWKSGIGVLMIAGMTQILAIYYSKVSSIAGGAAYLLSLNVLQQINLFGQAPFYSKLPIMAQLRAKGNVKQLVHVSQKGMLLSYTTLLLGFSGIALIGNILLDLLGSKSDLVQPSLWLLMCFALLVERYGAMHIQLYSTTNNIIWHISNGVGGALSLIVVFCLFPSLDVYALPLGALIGNLAFYSWYSAIHSYRSVNLSFWEFEKKVLGIPLILFCGFCIITYLAIQYPMLVENLFQYLGFDL